MSIVNLDFESRSKIDLPTSGLDLYATDPSTAIICMAYSIDKGPVQLWTPDQPLPAFMLDPTTKFQAFNAMFEWHIMTYVLKLDIKLEQMIDTMAWCGANNVPQSLEEAAIFLKCQEQKDPVGKRLINKLSKPQKDGTFNTDPVLLKQMYDYCIRDVKTELDVASKLRPLSDEEQQVWVVTQKINLQGVPLDPNELERAIKAVRDAQDKVEGEILSLTGCKATERSKLLDWVNQRGANMTDLTADSVKNKLVVTNLDGGVRRALELRQLGSLTSVAKYDRFQELQKDGRIRNSIIYHGSSTGRFAGRGAQLMNLPRGTVDVTNELIERVLERGEGGSLPELSSLVRSVLKAPEGYLFADCDYSSIENRLGVWVARQEDKLDNFRKGLDEYKQFCSESLYKIPYDSVTKSQRQTGKTAVLGCLYGLGYRGLTQYAAGFGVHMDEVEAKRVVDAYRSSYSKVKACWAEVEAAAMSAILEPGNAFSAGRCNFKVQDGNLWVQLPSRRLLRWSEAKIEKKLVPGWKSAKDSIVVRNQNTFTRIWGRNILGGPSIYQSIVQSLGRDILTFAMLALDNKRYGVVQVIHDQIVTLIKEENSEQSLKEIMDIMTTCPDWLTNFPLACEGFTSKRFSK